MINKRYISDYVFTTINNIFLVLVLIAVIYPIIFIISASISDPLLLFEGKIFFLPKSLTFIGYQRIFMNKEIWLGYLNTIIYTVFGTIINVVLTVMMAYPLSRKDFKARKIIIIFITFTLFFEGGIIPTYLIVNQLGLINTIWAMVLPTALNGFYIIIARTYFTSNIPVEMREVAFIDGCSNFRFIKSILIPLSKPIIAVLILFYSVIHWNSYFEALIYLTKREMYPLQIVLRQILIQSQIGALIEDQESDFFKNILMAENLKYGLIIISSLPMMLVYPFLQKYFIKGAMLGGIKG